MFPYFRTMAPRCGAQVLPRAPLLHCVGSYLYIACHYWFNAHKRNFKNTNVQLRIALALQCRRHYCHSHECPMFRILVSALLSIVLLTIALAGHLRFQLPLNHPLTLPAVIRNFLNEAIVLPSLRRHAFTSTVTLLRTCTSRTTSTPTMNTPLRGNQT
jgi:hypothetical protein